MSPARTFANPIIPGFNPDPSICRVGRDFYLVTSSFEYFPGLPIYKSRDLVNWRQIGHVLTRNSQLDLKNAGSSGGLFAPTIRHDGRRFVVVCTQIDGGGNFLVTATRAEGPWSEPVWLDIEGIDPSLCFAGGRVYYTRNGRGTDFDHPFIYQTELDPETWRPRGPMQVIWRGLGGIWPEAPHLYYLGPSKGPNPPAKGSRGQSPRSPTRTLVNGRWYLMAAEGGTSYGHTEVIARAGDPYGPFEPWRKNPILSHVRRRGHPIAATGHADLVFLRDGTAWAVFLGIRPKNGRHHHLGRETFLAPVTFSADGWPTIGNRGQVELRTRAPTLPPRPGRRAPARERFDRPTLAPHWMFLRNPSPGAVTLKQRRGYLRLWGNLATLDEVGAPAFVGRRQQHFDVRCRVALDFDPRRPEEEAGLTVRAREEYHLDVAVRMARGGAGGREVVASARIAGKTRILGRAALRPGPAILEIAATADSYELRGGSPARVRVLGRVPAKQLSAETMMRQRVMHFTGAVIGMYATGRGRPATSPADFAWFEYLVPPARS